MSRRDAAPRRSVQGIPSTRWRLLESLFQRVEGSSPEERLELFDREDVAPDLRAEVEELIGFAEGERDFLAEALAGLGVASSPGRAPAGRLGPYRLLEPIGRGGLGDVYLAERDDGQFVRRVAIKVVRPDLVTDRLLEDFRRERQILARLEHPNIARLYDGGTTDGRQPYLAMEFVEGETLDRHCERQGLGLEARLKLFLQICEAVSYSHHSLIIHRDLKMSNLLVTPAGAAKLLDFGIARPLEGSKGGQGEPAEARRLLLTPDYASPEQIRGEALTTGADLYALGVILFRLLAVSPPYSTDPEGGPEQWLEAQRSAASLDETARQNGCRWAPRLAGDLTTIVRRAMDPDPARRYRAVRDLMGDITAFLYHRPLSGREHSAPYLLQKFVRRHRVMVSAAALAFLALASGLAASTWALRQARQAKAAAEGHLAEVTRHKELRASLIESIEQMFSLADPGEASGETLSVLELIDRGVNREVPDPELGASLSGIFGRIYLNLGAPEKAEEQLLYGLATAPESHSLRRDFLWKSRAHLAEALIDQGRIREAEERLILDIHRYRRENGHQGRSLARLVHFLGVAKMAAGDSRSAASILRQALRLYPENAAGADARLRISETHHRLAQAMLRLGEYSEAEDLLAQVLHLREELRGPSHPSTLTAIGDLAALAHIRGENETAARLFMRVLAGHRQFYGPDHPYIAVALQNLAVSQRRLGLTEKALTSFRDAVAMRRRIHGEEHPAVADALYSLARFHHQLGELEAAEPLYRQAFRIRQEVLEKNHPGIAMALLGLADLDWSRGEMDRAEPKYRGVIARLHQAGQADAFDATFAYFQLGRLLSESHRAEAGRWLERAYRVRKKELGVDHRLTEAALAELQVFQEAERLTAPSSAGSGTSGPGSPGPD
ncbi:MAG: tetratricopeptide repeat protein [Acidobacteriota bacterium]